uniref:Uncharacterized protein n=1 Tax=Setaria italica TaxID=4555 RepID=K4A3R5_SETIT
MLAMKTTSAFLILRNKSFPGLFKVMKNSRQVGLDLFLFLSAFHYRPSLYFQ